MSHFRINKVKKSLFKRCYGVNNTELHLSVTFFCWPTLIQKSTKIWAIHASSLNSNIKISKPAFQAAKGLIFCYTSEKTSRVATGAAACYCFSSQPSQTAVPPSAHPARITKSFLFLCPQNLETFFCKLTFSQLNQQTLCQSMSSALHVCNAPRKKMASEANYSLWIPPAPRTRPLTLPYLFLHSPPRCSTQIKDLLMQNWKTLNANQRSSIGQAGVPRWDL